MFPHPETSSSCSIIAMCSQEATDGVWCNFWKIFCFLLIESNWRPWTIFSSIFKKKFLLRFVVFLPWGCLSGHHLENSVDCLAWWKCHHKDLLCWRRLQYWYNSLVGSVSWLHCRTSNKYYCFSKYLSFEIILEILFIEIIFENNILK